MKSFDAVVVGAVFTDFKGFAGDDYNPKGRNLGKVEITQGGVARNVADNLANLGLKVRFVSSVDDSMVGKGILSRLSEINVDTTHVKKVAENGMGIWMLINNKEGEQVGSLSQIPDPKYTEEILAEAGEEIIASASNVILEVDVSEKVTEDIVRLAKGKRIYALPATMDIAMKTRHLMSEYECFICNDIEAEKLYEIDTNGANPYEMLDMLKRGMKKLELPLAVVTMGAKGAVYCDLRNGIEGFIPANAVEVVDSSGAGDAFFSGTVAALINGHPIDEAVKWGTKLASLTIQCKNCNCDRETVKREFDL